MSKAMPYLLLKWGTLKGWGNITSPASMELLQKYHDFGVSMSAIMQHDSPEQKAVLLDLIRAHDGDIQNDWDDEHYTQDQAIDYVMNYGTPKEVATPPDSTK